MSIHKIGILTAGGDCPGLNAVVRAVSKNALGHGIEVLGFKNGFDGLVRNEFINITDETVSNILTAPFWAAVILLTRSNIHCRLSARRRTRKICPPSLCTILRKTNWML